MNVIVKVELLEGLEDEAATFFSAQETNVPLKWWRLSEELLNYPSLVDFLAAPFSSAQEPNVPLNSWMTVVEL